MVAIIQCVRLREREKKNYRLCMNSVVVLNIISTYKGCLIHI